MTKPKPIPIRVYRNGREVCNLCCKAGADEYQRRKRVMWERQNHMCCLYGFIPSCPGRLNWGEAMFAHEIPRGLGGGSRDDRIDVGGKRLNGVAHASCNSLQGSRRIRFNDSYNKMLVPQNGK
jgi:hypothetical protein